ncbi:1,3-beta-glucan synthase component-domain-containing protein [Lactarius hengduanensis]|nr:1,3-beta-glucan synthase component-domain-containing protein [Lactarius hengduanensis]
MPLTIAATTIARRSRTPDAWLLLHARVVDLDALEGCLYRSPSSIYSKILATSVRYKPKVLVSQIWNAIIISMYREHLLSIDHVQKLLYHQTDKGFKGSFRVFLPALPEALPVDAMPDYNEKILLSLREIIKEFDINTRVTFLEYLKQLHGLKWENFVRDTKILAQESEMYDGSLRAAPKVPHQSLPSARASGLRCVSRRCTARFGHDELIASKTPRWSRCFGGNTDNFERKLEHMARRKFKSVVSMQRYSKFNKEEHENAEFLLRAYPELQIAYLEEEPRKDDGEPRLYFALIDSKFNPQTDRRKPNLTVRIELPENPIRTNKGYGGGV